jgi:hypothetical protein
MLKCAASGLSLLTTVLMAVAGSASAQNITPPPQQNVAGTTVTECTGNLAPGNYDAVDVPAGANCTINSGTVNVTTGGVTVGAGATFFVAAPVALLIITSGSLNSTSAKTIEITAHIHGHVHLDGTSQGAFLTDSFVGGTVAMLNAPSGSNLLLRNQIGGSVLFNNNTCSIEANCNAVANNTIGSNLICMGNVPDVSPVLSGNNTVGGTKTGQCSSF